jgi:hypothetical protein
MRRSLSSWIRACAGGQNILWRSAGHHRSRPSSIMRSPRAMRATAGARGCSASEPGTRTSFVCGGCVIMPMRKPLPLGSAAVNDPAAAIGGPASGTLYAEDARVIFTAHRGGSPFLGHLLAAAPCLCRTRQSHQRRASARCATRNPSRWELSNGRPADQASADLCFDVGRARVRPGSPYQRRRHRLLRPARGPACPRRLSGAVVFLERPVCPPGDASADLRVWAVTARLLAAGEPWWLASGQSLPAELMRADGVL